MKSPDRLPIPVDAAADERSTAAPLVHFPREAPLRLLVIRRDNIGDLACTTPAIAALRSAFPNAEIAALVNCYNAPVLQDNPDLDRVFAYVKAKHREEESLVDVYWRRLGIMREMRRQRFDLAIVAQQLDSPRLVWTARLAGARRVLGFVGAGGLPRGLDIGVQSGPSQPLHEVEHVFRLLAPLGIAGTPGPLRVWADPQRVAALRARLETAGWQADRLCVGLHISARKESQRWPAQHFATLAERLARRHGAQCLLFWAPGEAGNATHPGDDDKARAVLEAVRHAAVFPVPTDELADLIAGISLTRAMVMSDGGAMHLAAGLGKRIVCFFGTSDATRWRPWGAPYVLLQHASREVSGIGVAEAEAALERLLDRPG